MNKNNKRPIKIDQNKLNYKKIHLHLIKKNNRNRVKNKLQKPMTRTVRKYKFKIRWTRIKIKIILSKCLWGRYSHNRNNKKKNRN